jgi:2-phospho-L-lactate guanylyltransferase
MQRTWIVIPAQSFDRGKTRLAPVLDAAGRRKFSRETFRHVVTAARRACDTVAVVSSSGEVLGLARRLGAIALGERKAGLVAAAHQGLDFARGHRAGTVAVIHADLPELSARELGQLVRALSRHAGMALVPDRDRDGTNAVAVRSKRVFSYRFGPASFAKHLSEGRRRRIRTRVLTLRGISRDVDAPDQYRTLVKRKS